MRHFSKGIIAFLCSTNFSLFLIIAGILFRISNYLANYSFYQDEAWRAFTYVRKTFGEIFSSQSFASDFSLEPVGFSFVEKLAIVIFGNNELVLRAFPLRCGIASIFLFYSLLKRIACIKAVPLALGFFIFSDSLIYYSAIVKQYSTELFIALCLYGCVLYKDNFKDRNNYLIVLEFIGVVSILFSYSSNGTFTIPLLNIPQSSPIKFPSILVNDITRSNNSSENKRPIALPILWAAI